MDTDGHTVKLAECDTESGSQKWEWIKYYY